MIDRYTRDGMKYVWSDLNKFVKFYNVEMAVCSAMRKLGKISIGELEDIESKATVNLNRIREIEQETHHDVIAFITSINECVGKNSKYIHKGMTSSDVVDTALALQIKEAGHIIGDDFDELIKVLKRKALEYKNTLCIGRTHGIHAEPMTFGLKILNWLDSIERVRDNFEISLAETQVGKISGAVGTYSCIDPKIEKITCDLLGLKPSRISTQIIPREIHAKFIQSLSLVGCVIERIATELRHLQRTEVDEVREGFSVGQKGSSAMPHKKNPISAENLCGLARVVRSNSISALENIALWHERDISHSSVERIIIPDSMILIDYMLDRLTKVIENMQVDSISMANNVYLLKGANFSSKILLALCDKGLSREEAYKITQKIAFESFEAEDMAQAFMGYEEILKYLNREEILECLSVQSYLNHIDTIYNRFELGEDNE